MRKELEDLVNSQVLGVQGTPQIGCVKRVLHPCRSQRQRHRKSGGLADKACFELPLWLAYHGVAQEEDGDPRVVLLNGVHMLQHVSDKNLEV